MSEFYIGWREKNPKQGRGTSRKFFLVFLALMIALLTVFTLLEKPFVHSSFSYGNQMVLSGQLIRTPVTAIVTQMNGEEEVIPLIGFGKFGPQQALEDLDPNEVYEVKISGTYIEYAGKKCLELTEGKASILSALKTKGTLMKPAFVKRKRVKGEVVDPKCFFGVMNPAYGKVHKSCAIRCISGQIPPVLAMRQGRRFTDFYFLSNPDGELLTMELLSLVGQPIQIKGDVYQFKNWKIIRFDPDENDFLIPPKLDATLAKCYTLNYDI